MGYFKGKPDCVAALSGLTLLATGVSGMTRQLPKTMVWSSYDVGSAGYDEASAIAGAFGQKFGTKIRIPPTGSAIGRLQPLLKDRADYGFLATEAFFMSEGIYNFATPACGPTELRGVVGRPASISLVTTADTNIHQVTDHDNARNRAG